MNLSFLCSLMLDKKCMGWRDNLIFRRVGILLLQFPESTQGGLQLPTNFAPWNQHPLLASGHCTHVPKHILTCMHITEIKTNCLKGKKNMEENTTSILVSFFKLLQFHFWQIGFIDSATQIFLFRNAIVLLWFLMLWCGWLWGKPLSTWSLWC